MRRCVACWIPSFLLLAGWLTDAQAAVRAEPGSTSATTPAARQRAPSPHSGLAFDRMPVNGALSQNSVSSILQDRSGLMWFGTLGGVDVYDGYSFRSIRADPRDKDSLSGVLVSSLFEDAKGGIWVGGFLGWLDRIDPVTGKVQHLPRELFGDPKLPPHFASVGFFQQGDGPLWIGTGIGLHRYDPATGQVALHADAVAGREPLKEVREIVDAGGGRLWVGTRNGLYRFDPATRALERFAHDANDPASLPGDSINGLLREDSGTLWVATSTGLGRLAPGATAFTSFHHDPADPASLGGDYVTDLVRDHRGRLWVSAQAGGALSLYREDGTFAVFRHSNDDLDTLSGDDVWSLFEDRSGLLWIGTAGMGMNQLNPSTHRFRTLRAVPFNRNSLSSSFVWDLAADGDGVVWLATLAGLETWDPRTDRFAVHAPPTTDPGGQQMQTVFFDRDGRLWAGSVDGHLYRVDPRSGQFTNVPHPDRSDGRFADDRVWYFAQAPDGMLWLSTMDELVALDPASARIVERIPANDHLPLGLTAAVRTSLVDSDGTFWLGGGGAGLIRIAPGKGVTAILGHDPGDARSLSDNSVRSLYEAPDGTLWIGTQIGLNRMDAADRRAARNRFTLYTTREGLPDNTVYGIVPDAAGGLWLSTNRGLARLDPATGEVRRYDARDGVAGDELNGGAELVLADGRIVFGGVNGLTVFRPEALPRNTRVPQVRLGRVEVGGRTVGGEAGGLESLELDYDHPDVTVAFASTDYHQPGKNRFRYRLGRDAPWIGTDRNSVSLARLPAGHYRLEVLASNNDGVWSQVPARMAITVHAAPWATNVALASYVLALVALLFFYDRAHRAKLAREREFSDNLASAHTLAEANHQLALRNAQIDGLTQLPNRASLLDAIARSMRVARAQERALALVLVNLDRFQRINDTIGHNLGDNVLKVTAERLAAAIDRADVLARGGSDEFAIVALRPFDREREPWLQDLAARIANAVASPHPYTDPPLVMSASIGVALYTGGDDTPSDLLGFANIAMHAAKRAGGHQLVRYMPGMIESAREKLSLEGRMQRALDAEEFIPYYQPLIDLRTRKLAGFEALIRWQPPGQKMIFPDQFIPLAEESGLIVEIGNLMIRQACRQLARWGRWDIRIAVNVSMRQLRSGTLVATIREALAQHRVPAHCLKLEITESAMMENVEDTAEQMAEIKALGVALSVDDFGTGFSSLSHLKMLPVDEMKIDRSFILDVAGNPHSQKIVGSIIRLAHELQLQVVAEGVEDELALAWLRMNDCDLAQGYFFDRPQPPERLEESGWLEPGALFPKSRMAAAG
jgi:diguanylate cyclase (GGDEF)-like protein